MSDTVRRPVEYAVALSYDRTRAPTVSAKGRGAIAERIADLAAEHGIPLREDPALAYALSQIPLGEEIPAALYVAVAEVLAFVYHLNGETP